MPRQFVRNPETGKPSLAVVNYQDVELDEIQGAVNQNQRTLDDIRRQKTDKLNELAAIEEREKEAETILEDSKSELEICKGLVEHSDGELDAGSDAGSGTDSDNDQEATQL